MQAHDVTSSRRERLTEMFNAINETQGLPLQQSFTPAYVMGAAMLVSIVLDRVKGCDACRRQCRDQIGKLLDAECSSPEEARQMGKVIEDGAIQGADQLPLEQVDQDQCQLFHALLMEELEAIREECKAIRLADREDHR